MNLYSEPRAGDVFTSRNTEASAATFNRIEHRLRKDTRGDGMDTISATPVQSDTVKYNALNLSSVKLLKGIFNERFWFIFKGFSAIV